MTWTKHILVVANVTAMSDELLAALEARAAKEPAAFTLIVPTIPFEGGRPRKAAHRDRASAGCRA
jgi:hypothetical protein